MGFRQFIKEWDVDNAIVSFHLFQRVVGFRHKIVSELPYYVQDMFPSLSESSGFPTLPFYECLLKRVLEAKNDNLAKLVLVQVNFTKKIDESQENKREYNLFSRKLGNKRGYE